MINVFLQSLQWILFNCGLAIRALSNILCSTIPVPVHDLKIKVTGFEFFCVTSLQCQLLQNLSFIWIVFGMNGYKMLWKGKARHRRAALSSYRSYSVRGPSLSPLFSQKLWAAHIYPLTSPHPPATAWQNQQHNLCTQRRQISLGIHPV